MKKKFIDVGLKNRQKLLRLIFSLLIFLSQYFLNPDNFFVCFFLIFIVIGSGLIELGMDFVGK